MQGLYPIYKPRKNKENRRMNDITQVTSAPVSVSQVQGVFPLICNVLFLFIQGAMGLVCDVDGRPLEPISTSLKEWMRTAVRGILSPPPTHV